jgi:hypothetical protein
MPQFCAHSFFGLRHKMKCVSNVNTVCSRLLVRSERIACFVGPGYLDPSAVLKTDAKVGSSSLICCNLSRRLSFSPGPQVLSLAPLIAHHMNELALIERIRELRREISEIQAANQVQIAPSEKPK